MTKFEGLSVGHRKGGRGGSMTGAQMRQNMAMYKLTGHHPATEAEDEPSSMPAEDAMRPRVYFVFESEGAQIGEPVVMELYEDLLPSSAREFRVRCSGAGTGRLGDVTYENAAVNFIWINSRIEAGKSRAGSASTQKTVPLEEHPGIHHSEEGIVSMSLQGSQFVITLAPAPHLDGNWQIVGRVLSGLDSVRTIAAMPADDDLEPEKRITIAMCGVLGGGGLERALDVAVEMRLLQRQTLSTIAKNETPAETSARVCGDVKSAVAEALVAQNKRKADEGAARGGPVGKKGMWDALLGGESEEDDESD